MTAAKSETAVQDAATGARERTGAVSPDRRAPSRGGTRPAARRAVPRLPGAGTVIASLVLAVVAVAAVWPELLALRAPDQVDPVHALQGPDGAHPFGTDQLGRDVFSRVVHGARLTITLGLGSVVVAVVAGTLLGLLAVAGGRVLDEVVMRVTDVLMAFPGLLLALLVVAVLGPGTTNAMIAIGAASAPGFARLVRGQALVVRESGYVQAAVVLGLPRFSVFLRHVVPNSLPPVLVFATVHTGSAIIAGSSLSFLGLGPQAPAPEWGAMLSEGRDYVDLSWGLGVFPGLAVTATVVAINVVGTRLRRRFEGRTTHGEH
ncbi:ABC transporter permease [Streptomyces abyssomicinicus]|uniref:ABC transporter permease n=1 Tax=Streptomyces abyssomicinicus TaxID=574929 RepID=UPI0012501CFC|nr:ABC transporter permease [Streptomyces abyssomicinicus]